MLCSHDSVPSGCSGTASSPFYDFCYDPNSTAPLTLWRDQLPCRLPTRGRTAAIWECHWPRSTRTASKLWQTLRVST